MMQNAALKLSCFLFPERLHPAGTLNLQGA
jgi:hypothetical protein